MPDHSAMEMFPLGADETPYRKLTSDFVSVDTFRGEDVLTVEQEGLRLLSETAFADINHLLRPGHLAQLAKILEDVVHAPWPGTALAIGAIISIFSVTLVTIYGQTRILFAMSRDGMISPVFHKVNPRTLAPVQNTVIVAVVIAVLAGFIPLDKLSEMTSIGTLTAFIVVSIGVMLLRRRAPELPRTFKVPLYPITPILSIAGAGVIIYKLQTTTLLVFAAWMALALLWYVVYARGHSKLNRHAPDMEDLLEPGGPS